MPTKEPIVLSVTMSRLMYLMHQIRATTADAVADHLKDLDLTGTQSLILDILRDVDGVSASELARQCMVSRQALSVPLDQLEQRGLVQRPESHVSVRTRPVELTEQGREVADDVRMRIDHLEEQSAEVFDPEERALFRDLLQRHADYWMRASGRRP